MERILSELEETNKKLMEKYSEHKKENNLIKTECLDYVYNRIAKDFITMMFGWTDQDYESLERQLEELGIRYKKLENGKYLLPD